MRFSLNTSRSAAGSILLIAVGVTAIVGIGLGSYLWMVRVQAVSIDSSQHWNAALAHAEAGVEEAMAHLNHTFGTNVNRAANDWNGPSGGFYGPVTRTLPGGGRYSVIISTDPQPIIYSTGFANVPITGARLQRTVKVQAGATGPFQVGMAAKLNISFKGNKIRIDSFDSADPNHSTNEKYDPAKAKAGGDVASTQGFVDTGNAEIKGKLKTGPSGNYQVGPEGSVGDLNWNVGGAVQPGWYENDFNYEFKDVQLPFTAASPGVLPAVALPTGTNKYVITGDMWHTGELKVTTGNNILVTDNARLVVDGDFLMLGATYLTVAPGATFEIYVVGAQAAFTRVNTDGNTAAFSYYGLPSNTSVTWGGNDEYAGTVYAPQATFTMGGGGVTPRDFQGACVVNEVVLNGHFNFHYDENLKRKAKPVAFTVGSWQEL